MMARADGRGRTATRGGPRPVVTARGPIGRRIALPVAPVALACAETLDPTANEAEIRGMVGTITVAHP